MSRIVIASNNPGKLRELAALLAPFALDAVAQGDLAPCVAAGEADEPHATFVENALEKARHASAACGLAALADDSGLCVNALGGAPGVRSARYADAVGAADRDAQDRMNNAKLVDALGAVDDRSAHYVACLVFVRQADDPEPLIAVGRWAGRIVDAPRGVNGFGYDAHFEVSGLGLTAAELDAATKNRISHRALAMARLVDELEVGGFVAGP